MSIKATVWDRIRAIRARIAARGERLRRQAALREAFRRRTAEIDREFRREMAAAEQWADQQRTRGRGMDEAAWLACDDPLPMVRWLLRYNPESRTIASEKTGYRTSERKLVLFAANCYPADANWQAWSEGRPLGFPVWSSEEAARYCAGDKVGQHHQARLDAGEKRRRAALLRDIVGNPFRPVLLGPPQRHVCVDPEGGLHYLPHSTAGRSPSWLDPRWLTPAVVGIARQAYESRDFAGLPVLADALEEAGCDNADILTHCRQEVEEARPFNRGGPGASYGYSPRRPATHVRGCWVVDLILGRE